MRFTNKGDAVSNFLLSKEACLIWKHLSIFCTSVIYENVQLFLPASCITGAVRLRVSDSDFVPGPLQRYLIDDELSVGRVEVCLGGRFGTICDTNTIFDDSDASVICQQLGFSFYGESRCL